MSLQARRDGTDPSADSPVDLPVHGESEAEAALLEASLLGPARAFLARPGKAFRARMMEVCFRLAQGHGELPRNLRECVELLHAGSLIVDDIQDDAVLRRGTPALHREIGVPRAINTGNWLYFVALSKLHEPTLEPAVQLRIMQRAHVCLARCHEGQALDLAVSIGDVKKADVARAAALSSRLKTGALFGFASGLAAAAAHADEHVVEALREFGERIGIALQMLDDVGSFASPERHAKAHEDLQARRVSWAWAFAAEQLDDIGYLKLVRSVQQSEAHGPVIERMSALIGELARTRIREAIAVSLGELAQHLGDSRALGELRAELARLEASYG